MPFPIASPTVRPLSLLGVAVALLVSMGSLSARADDLPGFGSLAPPRIFIIFDTSSSMRALPNNLYGTLYDDDFDPSNPSASCQNRFCIGKRELYKSLNGSVFTKEARIGLAGYYQYLLVHKSPSGYYTQCTYDVLANAGEDTYSVNTATFDTGTAVNATSTTYYYPSSTNLGSSASGTTAANCSDASTTLSGEPATIEKYQLTKTADIPTTLSYSCYAYNSFNSTANTYPATFSSTSYAPNSGTGLADPGGCGLSKTWTATADATVLDPTAFYQFVPYSVTDCSNENDAVWSYSGGLSSTTAKLRSAANSGTATGNYVKLYSNSSSNFRIGTSSGNWSFGTGASPDDCYSPNGGSTPCVMYLSSLTPSTASTRSFSWYGFFDKVPSPAPTNISSAWGTSLSDASNYASPASATYTWTQSPAVNTACATTAGNTIHNITSSLSAYGINTGSSGTFTRSRLALPSGYTQRENNDLMSSSYTCSSLWPCDVTLTSASSAVVDASYNTTWYHLPSPVTPTGSTITSGPTVDNNSGNYYWIVSSGSSSSTCPTETGVTSSSAFTTRVPSGCGTGAASCDFTLASTPIASTTASCSNITTYTDSSTPSNCSNGNAYTSDGGKTFTGNTLAYDISRSSSCPAAGSDYDNSGGPAVGGCPAGSKCKLSNLVQSDSSSTESYGTWYSQTAPSGYSGFTSTSTQTSNISWTAPSGSDPSTACPTAGTLQNMTSGIVGSVTCSSSMPCTVQSLGLQPDGVVHDGIPEKQCKWVLMRYTWTRPKYHCAYTLSKYTWTAASKTTYYCQYQRSSWVVRTPVSNTQWTCNWSMPVKRYDFANRVSLKQCPYFRLKKKYTYSSTTHAYNYQYTSRGGEIKGSFSVTADNSHYCNTTWSSSNAFGTACPLTYTSSNAPGGYNCSTHTCLLRHRTNSSPSTPSNTGRNANAIAGAPEASTCRATDWNQTHADPNTYEDAFCSQAGSLGYELLSDYYSPGTANSINTLVSNLNTAYSSDTDSANYLWNNQNTKESGWSAQLASGNIVGSPKIIPVPQDGDPDNSASFTGLAGALTPCVPPGATNVTINGSTVSYTPSGLCTLTQYNATNPVRTDYTPLYGAVKNAGDYLISQMEADTGFNHCRTYAMLLITDGLENEPGSSGQQLYSNDQLKSLVGDYWSHGQAISGNNGIYTSVIGFGNDAAGQGILKDMADKGHGQEFDATTAGGLSAAINQFLVTATAGRFSRTKPVLSSDGTRLYAAFFERSHSSLEWRGALKAYDLNTSMAELWSFREKLDSQSDSGRHLLAENGGTLGSFSSSNTAVASAVTSDSGFASSGITGGAATVVDFIRNPGKNAPFTDSGGKAIGVRTSRLDAIVHSTPVIVGAPGNDQVYGGATQTARSAYTAFQQAQASRPTRVLVGSNDGMLHGVFDRDGSASCGSESAASCPNGSEAWAYVPGDVQSNMYKYINGLHQSGVDATPSAADVCGAVSGGASGDAASCSSSDWKTYVFVALRDGGRSVSALDITNSVNVSGAPLDPTFVWRFADNYLGNTWSVPAVGRIISGTQEKFAVIFGGGKRCLGCSADVANSVYVVDALTGTALGQYIDVGHASNELAGRPGLYRPTTSPYISTAMLGGTDGVLRILRFGTTNTSSAAWAPAEFFNPTSSANASNTLGQTTPVMTADLSDLSHPQLVQATSGGAPKTLPTADSPPIYMRPMAAAVVDNTGTVADYYVGTGDANDPLGSTIPNVNYFYAIHDNGPGRASAPLWVFQMPHTKEQVISDPVVGTKAVIIASYVPPTSGTGCTSYGDAYLYALDPQTGALVNAILPTGASDPSQAKSVVALPNVGMLSDLVLVGSTVYYQSENGSGIQSQQVLLKSSTGSVTSWRRLQ